MHDLAILMQTAEHPKGAVKGKYIACLLHKICYKPAVSYKRSCTC